MNRDEKAMREMTEYCKQDVNLLRKVFKKLRPFINNMPNYNTERETKDYVCPMCGSTRLIKRGFNWSKAGKSQSYSCKDCFAYCSDKYKTKGPRI